MLQANSLSVSKDDLQMDLGCLSKTVPERKVATDYGYGDTYERLAVARFQRSAVQDYCHNCAADGCKAKLKSSACRMGDMTFEPASASLVGLFSYGIAGRITSPVLNVSTGKMEYISLLENSISEIRFCSFFSDLTNSRRHKYFSDNYDWWPKNFELWLFPSAFEDTIWKEMKDVEIPCTAQRKLRSIQKQILHDVNRKYTATSRHQLHVDILELQRSSGKREKQVRHSTHHLYVALVNVSTA
jgi:hypothetical protein